jgi:tetratricopeptide (TPR) repeat protein
VHETIPPGFPGSSGAVPASRSRQEEFGDLSQAADNFAQALEYYRAALDELESGDAEDKVRLLYKMSECARRRGDLDTALFHLRAAHEASRPLNDPLWTGRLAGRYAAALTDRGSYRRAARYAHLAYQLLRHTTEHAELGRADQYLGLARLRMGDYAGARDAFTSALATFRRIDALESMAMCLNNLGLVLKYLGQWGEAIRHMEQSLRLNEKVGNYALVATNCLNLGILRYRLGEWDLAEEILLRARQIMLETEDVVGEARVHLALGNLYRRRRQHEAARKEIEAARKIAIDQRFQRERVLADEFEGELEMAEGNFADAAPRLEHALAEARKMAPAGDLTTEILNRLALAYLRLEKLDEAEALAGEARKLTLQQGDQCERAFAERTLGLVNLTRGADSQATLHLGVAQRSFEELGERHELSRTFFWAAEIAHARSGKDAPRELYADHLKRSVALFRDLGVTRMAGEAALLRARMLAGLGLPDQSLAEVERACKWLRESREGDVEEMALSVRREIEEQYVASSISVSNEFRALEEANQLFREADDVHSVLSSTVRLAVENSGGDRGFVAFASGGGRLDVVATHNLGTERARKILSAVDRASGRDLSNGVPLFASRVAADPRFHAELSRNLSGVFSLVVVPLSFPSQAIGMVYVDRLNDNLRGAFNQRELNLLAVLAQSAAVPLVEAQRSVLLEENLALKQQLNPTPGLERVVTQSSEMFEIMSLLAKVGDSNATILLQGETGTGKGLLAQSVQRGHAEQRDVRDHESAGQGGGFERHHPAAGRDRNRQGAAGPERSRDLLAPRRALRGGQLRGPAGDPARERALRPRERGLHGGRPRQGGALPRGQQRHHLPG